MDVTQDCADAQRKDPTVLASAKRWARDNIWSFKVVCPFCGATHRHGGGDRDAPFFGHRIADCGLGSYEILGAQS